MEDSFTLRKAYKKNDELNVRILNIVHKHISSLTQTSAYTCRNLKLKLLLKIK